MANEDKSARYHRLQRRASIFALAEGAAFLVLLIVSGGSAAIRDAVHAWTGGSLAPSVAVYVAILSIVHDLLLLPLAYYQGVTLERRYGLSTQPIGAWWRDHVKAGGVGLVFAIGGALIIASLLAWRPESWWLAAGAVFALLMVVLAQLGPVLLLPLFYELKPLDRETLVRRLVSLAERAGARVLGVFEWRVSDRTRKANAALTGLGRTRRILLSDTLLAGHSDEEIEVILAHELAHHVHRDIWSSIAIEAGMILVAFLAADRVLEQFASSFGLAGKSDIAALPLIVLTAGGVTMAGRPVVNAISRAHERRADRYALEMTGNAQAFISAMKRLGATNLAEEHPSTVVRALFYTHPPIADRIAAARAWAQRGGT